MAIDVTPVPLAYHNRPTRKKLNIVHGRGGSKSGAALQGGGARGATGDGAALASREIISPDVVGLGDADMQDAVSIETQAPITSRGGRAIYQPGSLMEIITSGGSARANPDYVAAKPIGDDNLPYKPASGVGGWFRRAFMGDTSNTENIRAQQQQGQAWSADAAAKTAKAEQLAAEDRQFGRQKELYGLQSADLDKKLQAQQAIQDDKLSSYEARDADKLAAEQENGIQSFLDKAALADINNTSKETIAGGNNATKQAIQELRNTGNVELANAVADGRLSVAEANNAAKSSIVDRQIAGSMDRVAAEATSRQAIAAGKNDTGLAIQKLRNLAVTPKAGSLINPELFGGKTPYRFTSPDPFTHSAGGFGPVDGSGDSLGGALKGPGNAAAQRSGAKAAQQIQLERAQEGAVLEPTPEELAAWLKLRREKGGK
jgi:hypothetical protein